MKITVLGAGRCVTGSKYHLQWKRHSALVDCGLFQGRRSEVQEKNRRLPYAVDRIDAVVLSHAHIDHAGRLPFLAAQGYRGSVHCTPATRDLCEVMLADSAHWQAATDSAHRLGRVRAAEAAETRGHKGNRQGCRPWKGPGTNQRGALISTLVCVIAEETGSRPLIARGDRCSSRSRPGGTP